MPVGFPVRYKRDMSGNNKEQGAVIAIGKSFGFSYQITSLRSKSRN